jgi:hypothetical protein
VELVVGLRKNPLLSFFSEKGPRQTRERDERARSKEQGARMSVIMEEDSTAPMERSKKGGIDYEALDRDIEKQRAVALEVMC